MPGRLGVQSVPTAGGGKKPPPNWSFRVADLRTGVTLAGGLPFDDVTFNLPLNDAGTFGATLKLDQRIAPKFDIRDLTTPCRRAWYALRDDVPLFGGVIWGGDYDRASQTVSIGGADFWSYFDARKVVSTSVDNLPNDATWISRLVFNLPSTDQNSHARALVSLAQGHPGGHILVDYDLRMSGIPRTGTWYGYDLTSTGEALRKLSQLDDGPDIRFIVLADASAPGGIRRRLLCGTPSLGQEGSSHVFEYGKNLANFKVPRDGTKMATRSYALGDGMGAGMPIALAQDNDLYEQGWPVLEREESYSTVRVEDFTTLQEYAAGDQFASRAPVTLPTLMLQPGSTPGLGEINPGDDALLKVAPDLYYREGLETRVRINDIRVSYSSGQGERVTLVCAPLVEGVM